MIAECFLDTNVLVYAALGRFSAPEKYERAKQIVADEDYSTSAQVLQEFYVNAIRKSDKPLSPSKAAQWIEVVCRKPCQEVDSAVVMRGIENSQAYNISYWDGAIVAAAERLGVSRLYSEDLNHGQSYGSVQVINPFRTH
ncbi:MAG: PIN domain-containing protein [Rhizobiaceae bacterium]|jgi:predicted nucleic acid-binding protein|nr:PIN domain-containing protein [Rhizobiaceae bacterium]